MDYRSLSAVLIKTAGMLLIMFAVLQFSNALLGLVFLPAETRSYGLLAFVSPVTTGIIGSMLLRYPYNLVNRWIVPSKAGEAPADIAVVEQVVYAGIGVAVLVLGLQTAGRVLAVFLTDPNYLDIAQQNGALKQSVIQLLVDVVLGLVLVLGARGLVGLRRRLRGEIA